MTENFIRLGDRVINLANVLYIQVVQRQVGLVVQVYSVGDAVDKPFLSFSGTEGQALLDWCNHSVRRLSSSEEEIPIA